MDDLQVLKLVRCETCGSFVRDDAAYCFTCRNKSTEDQPKVKPKDLNALKQLESREQERRSREFQSLVQLALAKAPWRLLIRRYIHPFQEPEIQSAAREWVNADGSRPVEFPQPGWLKDIVRRMQPDDSQLDCLMRDVILMDTLLSVRAGNEWMLSDREQMLTEGFEILSEHTACPSENNPIASLLEVTRTRFAYQLCLLLDETNRSAEAEEYRTAARVSDVHLPQVNQPEVKDS